jgi:magnesium-transporting ATPase (P-type)
VSEEFFYQWLEGSKKAKLSVNNREESVAASDELIETDLELIGSTAIED